ncbi:MAG: hypothetical protein IJJ34_01975 [Clostridia bacterium]|nr:hypothetical protein [Clostridia bacterium]MBR3196201.1 hypothetical protein [Clostridia bacterium]
MKDHAYFYLIAADRAGEKKRTHADAAAERIRFSAESMQQQVFLARAGNREQWPVALREADVLIITADETSSPDGEALRTALEAFAEKESGNVILFSKTDALMEVLPEGTKHIRDTAGGVHTVLDEAMTLAKETAEDTQQEETEPAPAGRGNLQNILWLCGGIAVICLILRLLIYFLKR